jgi:Flp pilus assembly pilin Flp
MNTILKRSQQYGQGLVEYAVLIGLVSLISILALRLLGVNLAESFSLLNQTIGSPSADDSQDPDPLLYSTHFESDLTDWEDIKWSRKSSKNWTTENSKLISSKFSGIFLKNKSFDDFTYHIRDIDLSITGSGWHGVSVFFRATNTPKITGYSFRIQRRNRQDPGRIYFSRWSNGYQITPFIEMSVPADDFDWDGVHTIEVTASGSSLTASIDGAIVLQTDDETFSAGSVGIYTHSGSTITTDYLEVGTLE